LGLAIEQRIYGEDFEAYEAVLLTDSGRHWAMKHRRRIVNLQAAVH
jgi:hypothetical protein